MIGGLILTGYGTLLAAGAVWAMRRRLRMLAPVPALTTDLICNAYARGLIGREEFDEQIGRALAAEWAGR